MFSDELIEFVQILTVANRVHTAVPPAPGIQQPFLSRIRNAPAKPGRFRVHPRNVAGTGFQK